jgi:hypothetical protein
MLETIPSETDWRSVVTGVRAGGRVAEAEESVRPWPWWRADGGTAAPALLAVEMGPGASGYFDVSLATSWGIVGGAMQVNARGAWW